jgi:hypothetical protein
MHTTRGPPLSSLVPINRVVAREHSNGSTNSYVFIWCGVDEGLGIGRLVEEGGTVGGCDAVLVRGLEEVTVGPAHSVRKKYEVLKKKGGGGEGRTKEDGGER